MGSRVRLGFHSPQRSSKNKKWPSLMSSMMLKSKPLWTAAQLLTPSTTRSSSRHAVWPTRPLRMSRRPSPSLTRTTVASLRRRSGSCSCRTSLPPPEHSLTRRPRLSSPLVTVMVMARSESMSLLPLLRHKFPLTKIPFFSWNCELLARFSNHQLKEYFLYLIYELPAGYFSTWNIFLLLIVFRCVKCSENDLCQLYNTICTFEEE